MSMSYEISAAVGKQVTFIKVYKGVYQEVEDRQVVIGFTDGTELMIDLKVRAVTSALLYKPTFTGMEEELEKFYESPSDVGSFDEDLSAL